MTDSLTVLQGTLDILVLRALASGPQHGYAIARWIRQASRGGFEIEDGALYTALHRMLKRRWLEAAWGVSESNRRARYYRLTARGRKELAAGEAAWTRYTEAVGLVLSADPPVGSG